MRVSKKLLLPLRRNKLIAGRYTRFFGAKSDDVTDLLGGPIVQFILTR